MTIQRDKDIDHMVTLCFTFQRDFFKIMEKKGYRVIDRDKFHFIEKKLTDNEVPMLNNVEAKMFSELIDVLNLSLLDADPPYNESEMRFFKASQIFMKNYNEWIKKNKKIKNI